jgi:hypothetical protein
MEYNNVRQEVKMATERLEVRLDKERRRKLQEIAKAQDAPVSETVRRIIDKAYDDIMMARRKRAAEELGKLQIEDVPDPEELSRQLDSTYDVGDLYRR